MAWHWLDQTLAQSSLASLSGVGADQWLNSAIKKQAELTPDKILFDTVLSCDFYHLRDPVQARFSTCYLPFIFAVPAALSVCIVVGYVLRLLIPRRPRWMKPFVKELPESPGEDSPKTGNYPQGLTAALLIVSLVGFALQVARVLYPSFQLQAMYPAVSWAVASLLVTVQRPKSPPISLLALFITIFLSQLISLSQNHAAPHTENVSTILELFVALSAIVIILRMPIRDPQLSKEQISPAFDIPTHQLRSPEDNLTLWQFMSVSWMSPLISVGKARQLNDEDVWSLSYEFQHKMLHETFRELQGSVIRRLLRANWIDLVLTSFLGIIELLANFSVPLLLQQLLRAMENPDAPKSAAVTYAVLTMALRLIASQSDVLSLWFSRRCYERSRGEMITMLYEKTLNRKIVGVHQKPQTEDSHQEELSEGQANGTVKDEDRFQKISRRLWRRLRGYISTHLRSKQGLTKANQALEEVKEAASMGKILNLMRNDVYEVAQRFWEFQSIITKPLGLILSIVLVWNFIGWSCLIGIVTILVAQGIIALLARELLKWEKIRRAATDTKLQKVSQFVEAIRHLRWYGWQDTWSDEILESRRHELNLRIVTGLWNILIAFTNQFVSEMFPVVVFCAFTALAGRPLTIDIAFPALQLFRMLEESMGEIPKLITVLLNASVAVGRINNFMNEPDRGDPSNATGPESVEPTVKDWKLPTSDSGTPFTTSSLSQPQLKLNDASFAWPGASANVLHKITLTFPIGLTLVCGKVAAGKSALLQALLGELDGRGGELIRPDEMVGYCAQTPWLQSMSIRDNILFSSPYEESRYNEVLEVCALKPDMTNFKHGDLSNIGENGVGLSGGQKARVALARAVYSEAKILLLDDPLSALDHQTAESIVQKCLGGSLLKDRTTLLVTHRTEMCNSLAEQVVQISAGEARIIDPQIISSASSRTALNADLDGTSSSSFKLPVPEGGQDEELGKYEVLEAVPKLDVTTEIEQGVEEEMQPAGEPDKFIEDEHRAYGDVQASIYWEYIKAGKLMWWSVLICVLTAYRLISIAGTWFLKSWGEAYTKEEERVSQDPWISFPSPDVNVKPWLVAFFLLAMARAVLFLFFRSFMLVIIYSAGKQMFKDVIHHVAHATFRFYDVTPVGRLMNRLTSDINTIDGNISNQFQMVAFFSITWILSIVVIASVTPVFLAFSFALTLAFVLIFRRFLPTSQSLRRLEMVSLSPLMSNFGALLNGLTTVRAFYAQSRFQDRVIAVTDTFQKMDHFYWTLQAWLMYRFDALSAFSTFLLTMLALYTGVSPGLTAFVLIAASQFVTCTHYLCKMYGSLQMDFASVERVVELLHLEQEPVGTVSPPAWWPTLDGDIVFDDVTVRYAPHLDPSLSGLSFRIKAGSSTAIIGRTGSGKSTLALSLLATTLPESGHIFIDNIDISTIDRNALRHRVTFLAQDPVLFPGSMRQNLDPLQEYSDTACEAVLLKICGRHQWTLTTHVDTDGRNFSQGQRQLVGLARALLRRSAIVILDEATASIDMETSMWIQQVLHEDMRGSTVITIAHRLEAVKNAEFCIVLDKGRVVEHGRAEDMIARGSGSLAGLLHT